MPTMETHGMLTRTRHRNGFAAIALCCAILACAPAAWAEVRPARELDAFGHRGSAKLSVDRSKAQLGESIKVEVRFEPVSATRVFNPFFNGLLPYPARIDIFHNDGRYLGNLLGQGGKSRRLPSENDYVTVRGSGVVGCYFQWKTDQLVSLGVDNSGHQLAPGTYWLQVVYVRGFLNFEKVASRDIGGEAMSHFYDDYDEADLFWSAAVRVELAPKTAMR